MMEVSAQDCKAWFHFHRIFYILFAQDNYFSNLNFPPIYADLYIGLNAETRIEKNVMAQEKALPHEEENEADKNKQFKNC